MACRKCITCAHRDDDNENREGKERKVDYKCWPPQQFEEFLERMIGFLHDAKDRNKDSTCGDKQGANGHKAGEDVSEQNAGKHSVP